MTDNNQPFRPTTVDEQIEQLIGSENHEQDARFDAQLIQTFQHIYRPNVSAEDRASLARARQRITNQRAALPPPARETYVSPFQTMKSTAIPNTLSFKQRRPSWRLLSMLAAVLVIGLVVGSWIIVTHQAKQQGQAGQ